MDELLKSMGTLSIAVWAASEGLHQALGKKWEVARIAVFMGMLGGVVSVLGGWLPLESEYGTVGKFVIAIFLGLVSTMVAGLGHDKVVKPLMGKSVAKAIE